MDAKYPVDWFIDQSETILSEKDLFDVYVSVLKAFGFNKAVYTLITDHHSIGQKAGHGIQSNYPQDWLKHYQEKDYLSIDPVVPFGLKNMHAFRWQDIEKFMPLDVQQKILLREAEEAGLHNGVCIPLHGMHGEIAGVGLAQENSGQPLSNNCLLKIKALTQHFYERYCFLKKKNMKHAERPALTQKEIVVLTWVARGKTVEECSIILGCSPANIKYHISNIYSKLDAYNRILVVTKAIRLGYLDATVVKI